MLLTSAAIDDLPGIAAEPGEFCAGRSEWQTAGSVSEAAYFINDAGRIEKGVQVGTVFFETFSGAGYEQMAAAAEQPFLLFFLRLSLPGLSAASLQNSPSGKVPGPKTPGYAAPSIMAA
jgi:hypothetical protein